ncbi:uncharacterized protein ColSpa_03057 [Colletotrichum spaethianum]|uniref:Uncharacterized protein n=1 Tax=Colletotrichum spaethianum TaxID=700344 RepID=A0AA37P548_9PEZI|nr:uncharacterized protein ColSpa_03057 [Colletotrichum spaethianum]GKT42876.1 hypothetical protein ColSpa_03057 [Colletotrichum spaethianum]
MATLIIKDTEFTTAVPCITVDGISHDNHLKCALSSYNNIAFLPRRVVDGQQPEIHNAMIKSADMIVNLQKWLGEIEDCHKAEAMEPLLRTIRDWICIADVDLSLHNLQQLVFEDFDHWSHYESCLTHHENLDTDEPSDPKFNYTGFGPLNRDFEWDAKTKTISWRNNRTRQIQKFRVPQIVEAKKIWAGVSTPEFHHRWAEERHAHERYHQLSGTACEAWVDGPQKFHQTSNTANERTLTLYAHLAKKRCCSKCSRKGFGCTTCHSSTCSKNRITKSIMKTRSRNLTIRTKVTVSGDLTQKKVWSLREKKKLWDAVQAHVDKVATDLNISADRATMVDNIFIRSSFDRVEGHQLNKEERDAFFHAHRVGLCYETNSSLRDPYESIMRK